LSSSATEARFVEDQTEPSAAVAGGRVLGIINFVAALILMVLCAVAYGGRDPWWKAIFTCAIFVLGVFWLLERLMSNARQIDGLKILTPILALVALALLQTLPLGQGRGATAGISQRFWYSISADPYETRIFALELLALALLGAMLYRYVANIRCLRALIHVIIGIAFLSALFAILRQTMQHQSGFLLPQLPVDQGYGQFINRNHFAYLMEMGLGLTLGLVVGGGVRRDRVLIYVAASLPMFMALVLSLSRGGQLAMLIQLVVIGLLGSVVVSKRAGDSSPSRLRALAKLRVVRVGLVGALLVMVIAGIAWVGGDRMLERLESTRTGEFGETSVSRAGVTRLQIWKATGKLIAANPLFGVGLGGYWTAIPTYHNAPGSSTPQQAHNDYLELAASGGLVGLALGVWFFVVVFRRARTNLRSPDRFRRAACFAALIGIAGVATHSLVDFGLHRMANAMIFAGLIVIATCNAKGESDRLKSDV
jgi:O-antigen ligase